MPVTVGASSEQRHCGEAFYSLPSITIDPSRPMTECAGAHPAVCARQVCYATSNNAATISDLRLWRNRHFGTLPATPLMAGGGRTRRGRLVRNDCELGEPSIGSRGHGARRRRRARNAIFASVAARRRRAALTVCGVAVRCGWCAQLVRCVDGSRGTKASSGKPHKRSNSHIRAAYGFGSVRYTM